MRFLPRLPLAVCYLLLTCTLDCVAAEYDIYLLAGQSNMDGRGLVAELPAEYRSEAGKTIIFYRNDRQSSDGWQPLAPGFSVPPRYRGPLPSPTFGPEIGFAHAMIGSSPSRLALIKGSKGGTSLRIDWKPGKRGEPATQGPQYRDFIDTIEQATQALAARGDRYQIRGLLWHQGESDTKSTAEDYERRLNKLIDRIRQDVRIPDLPVVVGEVFDNGKRDSVREAIQAVAEASPTIGLVTADGLTTSDPGTHFDTTSQLLMGTRFADAIRPLSSAVETPSDD